MVADHGPPLNTRRPVSLSAPADGNAWITGLGLGALLALVVRPVLVGLLLWLVDLVRGERVPAL